MRQNRCIFKWASDLECWAHCVLASNFTANTSIVQFRVSLLLTRTEYCLLLFRLLRHSAHTQHYIYRSHLSMYINCWQMSSYYFLKLIYRRVMHLPISIFKKLLYEVDLKVKQNIFPRTHIVQIGHGSVCARTGATLSCYIISCHQTCRLNNNKRENVLIS